MTKTQIERIEQLNKAMIATTKTAEALEALENDAALSAEAREEIKRALKALTDAEGHLFNATGHARKG